jgi:2-C-methyl-D-erythritol 2,4-cyclodiphosphate synthase
MYRIGQGIDFHKLVEGREFWLGGILIPHSKGALGHSDADVLLHAICDALLGAVGLGDIGQHFPDTDQEFKGIDSKILLRRSYALVCEAGYRLVNIDSTVLLQRPKIRPHIDGMRQAIADILNVSAADVSIKATTTEQLSFIGREEGIVATANVMLQKTSS